MPRDFSLALLTGGSSGIGLAVAREFVTRGTSVILIARRHKILQEARTLLKKECADQARVYCLALDVSNTAVVREEFSGLLKDTGVPDLVYCGAGIAYTNHFSRISCEHFKSIMGINVGGIWNVLSVLVPEMRKNGGGTIVTVSSVAGLVGVYGYSAYSSSKFAVVGLSQSLRNELKPDGIRVKVLCPPDTNTPQLAEENLTKPEETRKINSSVGCREPEDIARALMRALPRRGFIVLPGFMSKLTWYLYRLFPWLIHAIIDNDVRLIRRRG